MGVSVVRAAFTKPNSTMVHLVVGEACYHFGARELRRLLEDVADTHTIQMSADPKGEAIHIQIRDAAQRIYSTMRIKHGAWHREPRTLSHDMIMSWLSVNPARRFLPSGSAGSWAMQRTPPRMKPPSATVPRKPRPKLSAWWCISRINNPRPKAKPTRQRIDQRSRRVL
ncbi:hypothetical protein Hgul01_04826 [Herpetosiphon gulosus]|uniref:Uncharacterized protein n=1 Tax=Herpetosiphon gulosus TaxID=1973496 RepID=A0ABP9X6I6_9CHLR